MEIRTLKSADCDAAGALLYRAYERAASGDAAAPPWPDEAAATSALENILYRDQSGDAVVAEEGGAIVGVGTVRVRGEVATLGPVASYIEGIGVGGSLVDALLGRADEAGAAAQRVSVEAWNPAGYALYAGRGFGVIDTLAEIERAPAPGPALASARGLEVRPAEAKDADGLLRLDRKLTGHDRGSDLTKLVRLVARRRGDVVGYLGAQVARDGLLLGPAVAVDASDLLTLLNHALTPEGAAALTPDDDAGAALPLRARLSTAAPAASMAALGLGFRIRGLAVVMSRGAPPPARPPQLYSVAPEIV